MSFSYNFRLGLSLLLCFAMLLVMMPAASSTAFAADAETELADLNSQYEKLEAQEKALQDKIDQAKTDKEKQVAIKNKTANDISILEAQIKVLLEKISIMETQIADKEAEIENLNANIEDSYQLFKQRLRALYMSDTSTTLGLVLGADSYGDYLARSETLKRISQHDQMLIDSLTQDKQNIETKKEELNDERAALEAAKLSVEAKNGELDSRLATTVTKIQSLEDMEKEFLANKAELQKQMKEVKEEIDAIYAQLEALDEAFVGGAFTLPVPGYSKITSYYGWRFGGADFHTGIDFSGTNVLGKTVVASNAGVVTFTNESYTPGRGYGRYMIVDHGGGYTTLYAHLSAITVAEGTRVKRGQAIAKVGSTGWSTGPHLHFEVRVNGAHQNPLNYLRV